MELVREKMQTQVVETEEAQKHNAMIKERYRRLQNAEASQFAEEVQTETRETENVYASVATPEQAPLYISPSNMNASVLEQTPRVTEYVSLASSPLFTTEKFDRMQSVEETAKATPAVEVAPVQAVSMTAQVQYSLSLFAKVAMAVFTMVIVAMLTLICVNTQLIHQKSVRIQNLEEQKENLMAQYEQLQSRIDDARAEDTILQYAQEQGWTLN